MDAAPYVPYCGSPPVPGALAWNTDPILAAILLALLGVHVLAGRRPGGPDRRERAYYLAGWAVAVAALMSPLCHLSVALFSARVSQHVILLLVAAPLVVLGRPDKLIAVFALSRWTAWLRPRGVLGAAATAGFTVALWTWHLPGPYDATLGSDLVYWAMHLTTFGAALALWHVLLAPGAGPGGTAASILAALVTSMQMSLLGAILTLAPRPLFAVHAGTTGAWGFSPLDDQQLGGLVMWVPGGLLFMLYFIVGFGAWLRRLDGGPIDGPAAAPPTVPEGRGAR